jgi:hypothetical protein
VAGGGTRRRLHGLNFKRRRKAPERRPLRRPRARGLGGGGIRCARGIGAVPMQARVGTPSRTAPGLIFPGCWTQWLSCGGCRKRVFALQFGVGGCLRNLTAGAVRHGAVIFLAHGGTPYFVSRSRNCVCRGVGTSDWGDPLAPHTQCTCAPQDVLATTGLRVAPAPTLSAHSQDILGVHSAGVASPGRASARAPPTSVLVHGPVSTAFGASEGTNGGPVGAEGSGSGGGGLFGRGGRKAKATLAPKKDAVVVDHAFLLVWVWWALQGGGGEGVPRGGGVWGRGIFVSHSACRAQQDLPPTPPPHTRWPVDAALVMPMLTMCAPSGE